MVMKILDGRYRYEGRLSERGPVSLWQATDQELRRPLLIREMTGRPARGGSAVDGMLWACCALSQIRHPNLEEVIALREDNERNVYAYYTAHESVSCRDLIGQARQYPLRVEEVLYIIGQAASALARTHTARERVSGRDWKLYHHALTPERLQVTRGGQVLVTDFGIASLEVERPNSEAAYFAPEQLDGSQPDGAADIFSLGVIAYEMLTGRALFAQNSRSELMTAILKGEYDLSELSRITNDGTAVEIITRCLYRELHHRYQSAAQLADKIKTVLQQRDFDAEKKLRERVANLYERPKLEAADVREENLRTHVFDSSAFIQSMGESMSGQGQSGGRKPRPGEETVIASLKVGEKVRRLSPGGGNNLIKILAIVAGVLVVAVVVVLVMEYLNRPQEPVTEMVTDQIRTLPENAQVYQADSLLGTTPGVFTLKPGTEITIKHDCCPDTTVDVDFEKFAVAPIELTTMVRIASNPIGADIELNGEVLPEKTPYDLPVRAIDTIQVKLSYSGKKDITMGPTTVGDLASLDVDNFDTDKLEGGIIEVTGTFPGRARPKPKVSLVSYPSGAKVTITGSGKVLGETPLDYRFGDDAVKLTLTKDGYEDRICNLPIASARKSGYRFLLYRRVYVTAYEEGDIEKTVNCRIKRAEWDNENHSFEDVTPAYLRLPGVDCRLVLTADGYIETDTLVAPAQDELIAVMRPRGGGQTSSTPPTTQQPANEQGIPAGKAEVTIFVTNKKDQPVAGAAITAEYEHNDKDENLELGLSDADGKLVVNLFPGKYKFIAKHIDYKIGKESQDVKAGSRYVKTIEVKRR